MWLLFSLRRATQSALPPTQQRTAGSHEQTTLTQHAVWCDCSAECCTAVQSGCCRMGFDTHSASLLINSVPFVEYALGACD